MNISIKKHASCLWWQIATVGNLKKNIEHKAALIVQLGNCTRLMENKEDRGDSAQVAAVMLWAKSSSDTTYR